MSGGIVQAPALLRTGICRLPAASSPSYLEVCQALYAWKSSCSPVRATGLVTLPALGAIAVGLAGGTFPAGVLMLITEM